MAETMAAVENDDLSVLDMPLTIRVKKTKNLTEKFSPPISPSLLFSSAVASPHLLNSPSLISPPSSAFVSALQSPYISPRAVVPAASTVVDNNPQLSPAASCSGSHSEDIPSSSYTPPIEDENPRFSIPDTIPARISFSFPAAPRVSFSRRSLSPTPPPPAKLRSCDVYIGFHGQNNNLMRFCKWLKSELELQGIACFVADRARYSDSQSVEITERIICAATYGIVVVAGSTFFNSFSMEEIKVFNQKKNLIPLLFETDVNDVSAFLDRRSDREKPSKICRFQEKEWIEMVEGLIRSHNEFKLEANDGNWRNCISKAVGILKSKLGRKSLAFAKLPEPETEEFPFLRNNNFVGREKELHDLENFFFNESEMNKMSFRSSDGFSSDDEHDGVKSKSSFINLEMRKCKEPTLEAWIDPVIELTNRGRSPQKHRQKHRRLKHAGNKKGSVIVLNGGFGIGKTEIALEFAYRYAQRYKMVLWIGGDAKYIRNNVLNLSSKLNLDVTAEAHHEHEHERLRVRGFEEQEHDAFQRIKRELFRDVPYLLVIDNLESEKETWDNKDLQDFIPKTTGATHVIITTGLHKVLNFETLAIHPLLLPDALTLLKGKKKKDYPTEELDVLRKFYDRLGRSTFGLGLISCLLHELPITPAELFEAVNRVHLNDSLPDSCPCNCSSSCDDQFYKNNPFLMRAAGFCFDILCSMSAGAKLSHRMVFVSAWLHRLLFLPIFLPQRRNRSLNHELDCLINGRNT